MPAVKQNDNNGVRLAVKSRTGLVRNIIGYKHDGTVTLLILLFYSAGMIIFDVQHLFYWKMWRPVCSDIFRALLAVPPLYYLVTYWFEYGIWLMTAACMAAAVTIRLESYWQYMLGTFLGLAVLFAVSDVVHAGLSLSAMPQLVLTGLLLGSPYTALTAGLVFIVRKRNF